MIFLIKRLKNTIIWNFIQSKTLSNTIKINNN